MVTENVVLDVDGTLMDTNYLHVEAWARAFGEVGMKIPRAAIHRQVGRGSDQLISRFTQDEGLAERINALHSEYYAGLQEFGYPLPGASEMIRKLSERGYGVWFVTSAKPEELEHHLRVLGAGDHLSGIVSSGDVERSKPAPEIFELALERSGASSEETVAVGDSVWDVEAAGAAGIRTFAVLTGGAFSEAELREAGAVEVYRDCEALLASGFPG